MTPQDNMTFEMQIDCFLRKPLEKEKNRANFLTPWIFYQWNYNFWKNQFWGNMDPWGHMTLET